MPSHRVHLFVDRLLFGRGYKRLHVAIDYPVRVFGRSHRRFFHTVQEAVDFAILLYGIDEDAVFAARFHVWLDYECSRDKKFRRLLMSEAQRDEKSCKNPWATGLYVDQKKITREDLLLRFFASIEKQQWEARSKYKPMPKKIKNRTKRVKKRNNFDDFLDWVKFYKEHVK